MINKRDLRTPVPRPASVTLLALLVLSIAGINLIRFVKALAEWEFWAGALPISPLYLALSGLTWVLTCAPLAWGLWRGAGWASDFSLPAAGAFCLYYWLDRLFLRGGVGGNDIVFDILLTALFLIYVRWSLKHPAALAFFTR